MTFASQIAQIPPAEGGGRAHERSRTILDRSAQMLDGVVQSARSGNSREFYTVLTNVFDACGDADYVNNFPSPQEAWRRCTHGKRDWWVHSCANRIQQDDSGEMAEITDSILRRPDRVWNLANLIASWLTCARREVPLGNLDQYDRQTLTLREDANTNGARQLTAEEIYSHLWLAIHPTIEGPALEAGLLAQRTGLLQALQTMPRAAAAAPPPDARAGVPTIVSGHELVRSFAEPAFVRCTTHGPNRDANPANMGQSYAGFGETCRYARRFALSGQAPQLLHRLRAYQLSNVQQPYPTGPVIESAMRNREETRGLWEIWRDNHERRDRVDARWWVLDHPYTLAPEAEAQPEPTLTGTPANPRQEPEFVDVARFRQRNRNPDDTYNNVVSGFVDALRYAKDFDVNPRAPRLLRDLAESVNPGWAMPAEPARGRDAFWRRTCNRLYSVWCEAAPEQRARSRWYVLEHPRTQADVPAPAITPDAPKPLEPQQAVPMVDPSMMDSDEMPAMVNRWRLAVGYDALGAYGLCTGSSAGVTNAHCRTCDTVWTIANRARRQEMCDAALAWSLANPEPGEAAAVEAPAEAAPIDVAALTEQITQRVVAELRASGVVA